MENPFGKKNIKGFRLIDRKNGRSFKLSYTRAKYNGQYLFGETAKYTLKDCQHFDGRLGDHVPEKGDVLNAFWECGFWRIFLGRQIQRIYEPDTCYIAEYEENDEANMVYEYFRDMSLNRVDGAT